MNLLPKYLQYKIASELSSKDLYNLHLTSKDNYQRYKSDEFWANKLKISISDWQSRSKRSGALFSWDRDTKPCEILHNVYHYRTLEDISSYIDVFGNLYLKHNGETDIQIFGQDIKSQWTKISVGRALNDFIIAEQILLLTQNQELHIMEKKSMIIPADALPTHLPRPYEGVKKIGCISYQYNECHITYFLTVQRQLYVIENGQNKLLATNVTHVLESKYYDHWHIGQLFYVIQSMQVWRYYGYTGKATFELSFDCVDFLQYHENYLYVNEFCYADELDQLIKMNGSRHLKGIFYGGVTIMHDNSTSQLKIIKIRVKIFTTTL